MLTTTKLAKNFSFKMTKYNKIIGKISSITSFAKNLLILINITLNVQVCKSSDGVSVGNNKIVKRSSFY